MKVFILFKILWEIIEFDIRQLILEFKWTDFNNCKS